MVHQGSVEQLMLVTSKCTDIYTYVYRYMSKHAFIIHRSTVSGTTPSSSASSNETALSTPADSNVSAVPVFYPHKGSYVLISYLQFTHYIDMSSKVYVCVAIAIYTYSPSQFYHV